MKNKKPTTENTLSNTYFILSIMMDLLQTSVGKALDRKTIELKQQHGFKHKHKQNHAKMVQGIKLVENAVEHLAAEYAEYLPLNQFDLIRQDANYMLRCLLLIINASPNKEQQANVENMLRAMDKQSIFPDVLVESFRMR